MSALARIAVVGSINVDVVTRAARLPVAGETQKGSGFALTLGGKGANQAIAAARLGASVAFVARTGVDAFGDYARKELTGYGLDLPLVGADTEAPTGVATIFIDAAGQNAITIVGGANDRLSIADIAAAAPALSRARCLLLQCETPEAVSIAAARQFHSAGGGVILDPAPVPAGGIAAELLKLADIVTPNETEAHALTGITVADVDSARAAADVLFARGAAGAVIKMGAKGAFYRIGAETGQIPPFSVTVVDTVAAGDSFNAGLAVALAEGITTAEAIRMACACGALATTRAGAAAAAPMRDAVEKLLKFAN